MPSRILKDSILTDKAFNTLTLLEESIYHRLTVSADDYGVFYADPVLLLRVLFPRKKDISEEDVREGLDHLEETGLIFRYAADGEDYLKISAWEKNQRPRNTHHKFPYPEADGEVPVLPAAEEKEKAPEECTPVRESPAADEIVIDLLLNDNTLYNVTQGEISEFSALYPAVDVLQEYRGMKAWCMTNAQKRKTRNGIKKFINNWLANAQKQNTSPPSQRQLPTNPFL